MFERTGIINRGLWENVRQIETISEAHQGDICPNVVYNVLPLCFIAVSSSKGTFQVVGLL